MGEGEHPARGLVSVPLMKISGARSSLRAKPRNSAVSSGRWELCPTIPLAHEDARLMLGGVDHHAQGIDERGRLARASRSNPTAWRMRAAVAITSLCTVAEPMKSSGGSPSTSAFWRYQSSALLGEG